jgi:hypothetical protein
MSNEITTVEAEVVLLDDPGEGFQSRNAIYTVAKRLISHTAGKIIGGYKAEDGKMYPIENKYAGGDLILSDAMYAVEFALTRGLNPYGHLHLWYHRSTHSPKPQLIIDIDYKILKGWAEWRAPFKTHPFKMNDEERQRYGLQNGDLGTISYNVLDSDASYFHQYQLEFIRSGMPFREAQRLAYEATAKSFGIGIIKAGEMKKSNGQPLSPPKGRTWQWRAETRAFRDTVRRSHGEPPPAQIRQYSESQGMVIDEQHLSLMAAEDYPAELSAEDQQRYLQAGDVTETPTQQHDLDRVNATMRNNGDDDPLELSPEEAEETSLQPPKPPAELVAFRQKLLESAAKVPQPQKQLSQKRSKSINDKLAECFAPDEDAEQKGIAVKNWLFENSFGYPESQVLILAMLRKKDQETGEIPLKPNFVKMAKQIYRQYQLE